MSLEWMMDHIVINSFLKLEPTSTAVNVSAMGALNNWSSFRSTSQSSFAYLL